MTETLSPSPLLILASKLPPGGVFLNVAGNILHVSPFQYRKTYNEAKLEELTASIRETGGIHQPMLVRRRFPNVLRTDYEPENGLEIVSGHRRMICGQRAMLPLFPVLVKDLTNDQVRKIQITENLQREDVHPFEEAEGLHVLMEIDGLTADQIADQLGKSRSYVYGRLALLKACPKVRDACIEGKIGSEVALLVSRLRTEKLQQKALQYIAGKSWSLEDGGKRSFRQIRDLLAEHFTLDLKKPLFDPEDAQLVPAAGACGNCPKRVGNAPEYEDLMQDRQTPWRSITAGNPNSCTDPDCYATKKAAHLSNEAAALEAKGKVVVDGSKARAAVSATGEVKGAYISLQEAKKLVQAANKKSINLPLVSIQDPRSGKVHQAVKREDLKAAGVKLEEPKKQSRPDWEAERRQREEQEKRDTVKAQAETAARLNVLQEIRKAFQTSERSLLDMQLIAGAAWAGVSWSGRRVLPSLWTLKSEEAVDKAIKTMAPGDLALFVFDCALVDDCFVNSHSLKKPQDDLLRAAAHYGVDVKAARGDSASTDQPVVEGTPTPSTAAREPKKAKAKGKTTSASGAKVKAQPSASEESQTDEAGSAGGLDEKSTDIDPERDPNTSDMFEEAPQ